MKNMLQKFISRFQGNNGQPVQGEYQKSTAVLEREIPDIHHLSEVNISVSGSRVNTKQHKVSAL